jgi:Na+/melibiose symporter-like transporter
MVVPPSFVDNVMVVFTGAIVIDIVPDFVDSDMVMAGVRWEVVIYGGSQCRLR